MPIHAFPMTGEAGGSLRAIANRANMSPARRRQEGKEKAKLEIARTMLVKGMEISLISEITGLKEEEITQNSSNGHNEPQ